MNVQPPVAASSAANPVATVNRSGCVPAVSKLTASASVRSARKRNCLEGCEMKKWLDEWFEEYGDLLGMMLFFLVVALFFKGCDMLD